MADALNNRAGLLKNLVRVKIKFSDIPKGALSWMKYCRFRRTASQKPTTSAQGKYADADSLYARSQRIREEALGPDHPGVAQSLNNRAELLRAQVRVYCDTESNCF